MMRKADKKRAKKTASRRIEIAVGFGLGVLSLMISVLSLGTGPDLLGATFATLAGAVAGAVGFYFESSRDNRRNKLEKRQVFIVHAHEDLDKARVLAAAVRDAGYSAWLDYEQIAPGESIADQVERAIKESGMALYIPPSGSRRSYTEHELRELAREVTPAGRRTNPVVPVVDSAVGHASIPSWLADVAPLSLSDPEWRSKLSRALDSAFVAPFTGRASR